MYGSATMDTIKKESRAWTAYFKRLLPSDKNVSILDLGCGNGGFVYWLASIGFSNVFGIDISAEQIRVAQKLGVKNIVQADAREFLKDRKSTYDLIIARDFLEHFSKEELLELTSLIFHSLKTGGTFIVQTVNAESLLWGRLRHGDLTHKTAFTSTSIAQLLRLAGFREIHSCPERPPVLGIKSFVRRLLWHVIELKLHLYLLIVSGSASGIFTQDFLTTAKKHESS